MKIMKLCSDLQKWIVDGKPWQEDFGEPLKEMGFENPEKSWKILQILNSQVNFPALYPKFFAALLEHLSQSYDPEQGLINFERFAEKIFDKNYFYSILTQSPGLFRALIILFSGSQVLTDTLLKNPSHFDWLNKPETLDFTKSRDVLYRDYHALAGEGSPPEMTPSLLRQFKQREVIRIGLRDLMCKADVAETVGCLADLADVCLQVAYEYVDKKLKEKHGIPYYLTDDEQEKEAGFVILSMGKLGGQELNFSSDIDLIYIYTSSKGETKTDGPPNPTAITLSNHEYFSKLAQLITKTISEITDEGNVFRVDLNLRPEGQSGEITNSLTSCETYYQSWGKTWERQALIKARVSAGSEDLGKKFFSMISPFIYRRSLDFSAIEEIKSLKKKIDDALKKKKLERGNIKLGAGGIREIEFIVQAYQLLFGGRDKSLREPNTLITLQRLRDRDFITQDEHQGLEEAYVFLRKLENMVQISFGLQTHILPTDDKNLSVLARKMGIKGGTSLISELNGQFEKHTRFVGNMFDNLFVEAVDKVAADEASREWEAQQLSESKFNLELLEGARFQDPQKVLRFLVSLRDGPELSHPTEKSIKAFYTILPGILELCGKAPNPDSAVENLVKFVEASQARETFLKLFNDNEKLLELLIMLFGSSDVLSSVLIKQPALMEALMNVESLYRYKSAEKLMNELQRSLKDCPDLQSKTLFLRKFKQGEELRIGVRYLIAETDLPGTLVDLSNLADVFLKAALALAKEEVGKQREGPGSFPDDFAIIGMGKLGGREINFGSDLDIIFVYDEKEEQGSSVSGSMIKTYFESVAQMIYRLTSEMTPAGLAYKIDADLRPEGSGAHLALSVKGYENYFKSRARIWERQAMTRARFVAGKPGTGKKFMETAHTFTYQKKLEYGSLVEIARLRTRMEKELALETKKGKNVKLGYGGLADIEFTAQVLQLMHGYSYPQLRATNTLEVLRLLSKFGIINFEEA
ncbi:MAG: bifunctional [glutamate--ammonia ligase]-adenylyl-L-tyrosine phosphorylase/[glutamate--ammonia-ligase] adenylyltransferase, partial [Nitrospinae bacterium]|nr:bifunctional [glutamate--ammonia ligase]-adenylyl-L-tyrosine phosphorylase/[glutamate--ammonia-ligase] adenylyltransferase [Nitrospinota bacterium]